MSQNRNENTSCFRCSRCGEISSVNETICKRCGCSLLMYGEVITNEPAPQQPTPRKEPPRQPQQPQQPPRQPQQPPLSNNYGTYEQHKNYSQENQYNKKQKRKKTIKKFIIIYVVITLLFGALGFAFVELFDVDEFEDILLGTSRSSTSQLPTETPTEKPTEKPFDLSEDSIIGNTSDFIRTTISYSNINTYFKSESDVPESISVCYENEEIYFNAQAADGIYIKKLTYYIYKDDEEYVHKSFFPEDVWFNYLSVKISLQEGEYEIYWVVEFSDNENMKSIYRQASDASKLTVKKISIMPSQNHMYFNCYDNNSYELILICDVPSNMNYCIKYTQGEHVMVQANEWNNNNSCFLITPKSIGEEELYFVLANKDGTIEYARTKVIFTVIE